MDLTLTEMQRDFVGLAAEILDDANSRGTADGDLWRSLAKAGLLGVAVPEKLGGLGLGFVEVGLLLEQVGRTAGTVPLLGSLGAAMVVRDLGSDEQQLNLLAPLAAGDAVLTAALTAQSTDPRTPMVCAAGEAGRWVLRGVTDCVPAGPEATHFVIAADLAGVGPRLIVLAADRAGLDIAAQPTMAGTVDGYLTFDEIPLGRDDVLGRVDDDRAVALAVRYATAASCAVMAGALARVVELTAAYTSTRQQFDRPIGSFQAVGQRVADAFTSSWAVELTARQACWYLADGRSGDREVALAKYTAASAGAQVIRAAHHLHGGIGLDRDYPLHRYTTLTKRLELMLGGASEQAAALGELLATEAARAVAGIV